LIEKVFGGFLNKASTPGILAKRSMTSIFVYSAGETASDHFEQTIRNGLPLATLAPFLSPASMAELARCYPDGNCYLWGDRGGEHGRGYWNQMAAGDLALCYRERKIVAFSTVLLKVESEQAGKAAWPDATSDPYRLLFFLSKPTWIDLPVATYPQYFGKVYQGLRRLRTSDQVLQEFGAIDRFVNAVLLGAPRSQGSLPDSLSRDDVLEAIRRFDAGESHRFADSTGYDLVFNDRRYPPKAIAGLAARVAGSVELGPEDFSGGEGSKCFRILRQAGFEIVDKSLEGGWIFQGNPDRYDIDDYLSRYTRIYWSAPRHRKQIRIGDRCLLWRAGPHAGVVAVGRVVESATPRGNVQVPECLGDDLWRKVQDNSEDFKVGIRIDEVRLDEEAGFVPRQAFINSPSLSNSTIIRAPNGTVFQLSDEQMCEFNTLWAAANDFSHEAGFEAVEGNRRLRKHFARERCRTLITKKRQDFAAQNDGRVFCEVCGFDFGQQYPPSLGEGFIEVHHLSPLFDRDEPLRTTLADLMMVCSNCHRMIHRSRDADGNLNILRHHFTRNTPRRA
jgi:hypothetical protein